ncbi:MAG TPA: two-component regulator propeller domain-containing protein, partial [Bacteroidia bacterium]|nr:two-component regulator propeller domain-containing protein [Bacteroidia bacterium]
MATSSDYLIGTPLEQIRAYSRSSMALKGIETAAWPQRGLIFYFYRMQQPFRFSLPSFRCLLFCMFTGFVSLLSAQQMVLKNYTAKDGLASNEVYCAIQDSRGFVWFGTDGGVSCFDGYTFKNYTTEDGLADNTIFGITEDSKHRLWFRSLSGRISYWKNDSIYSVKANDAISSCMGNSVMTSLYVDRGDTIWCGLRYSEGYFKISPDHSYSRLSYVKSGLDQGVYLIHIEGNHYVSGCTINLPDLNKIRVFEKTRLKRTLLMRDLFLSNLLVLPLSPDTFLMSDITKLFSIRGSKMSRVLVDSRKSFDGELICL